MSRILKRPMFRKGGMAGEGIMSKVEPRQGYSTGQTVKSIYEQISPLYEKALQQQRDDTLANFLTRGGLNLIAGSDKDVSTLQALSGAYRQPLEQAIKARQVQDQMQAQGKLAALGAAAKIAGVKRTRPLKDQTIEGQVENFFANMARTASGSKMDRLYGLKAQITKAFRSGISPRIAPTNIKGTEIDRSFYVGKPNGSLYINPITGLFEMVIDEKPFRRIDQDTLKPITKER